MSVKQLSLPELLNCIAADKDENRFVSRVFFVSNLNTYYSLIEALSIKADIVVCISDDRFCTGIDTVPDLKVLNHFLDDQRDKNILLPHLGEYLRIGEATERNAACLYSILSRHVHSTKRVWIPIFAAKGLFQSVVGELDEERFGSALFEIDEVPMGFSACAYSKALANQSGIVDANGLKSWLALWDNKQIESGMSFATRQIKQLSPSSGNYELTLITDPFTYVCSTLRDGNVKIKKELGTDEQWTSLVPYASTANGSLESLVTRALNLAKFNPYQILSSWSTYDLNKKWLFYLWFKLGLNQQSDYISFALSMASTVDAICESIECSILSCTNNPNFEEWVEQRRGALDALSVDSLCHKFWMQFDRLNESRIQLKILTGKTHDERTKIIELISKALGEGRQFSEFKTILKEKYHDLALYLSEPQHLNAELSDYMCNYKLNKVAGRFSLDLSKLASEINLYDYKSRGQILFSLKAACNAYYLWIDGMGIEWIELLLDKVKTQNPTLGDPIVTIGTAILPTITTANMEKADPDTISEKKFDALDSLSHIKDKSDCNYHSVMAKQFEMMDIIANLICQSAEKYPDKDIVVTADHGMSRMAAMGFHKTDGIDAPTSAKVCNLGRYCEMPSADYVPQMTNTMKEKNILAFKTYNHFTVSGYAPGELHGGASPEEVLVPIIHFRKLGQNKIQANCDISYELGTSDVYLDNGGETTIFITTNGIVSCITVEINSKQLQAQEVDRNHWSVLLPGLSLDQDYSMRIYLNNIFTAKEEKIHVKRKGMVVDDDL